MNGEWPDRANDASSNRSWHTRSIKRRHHSSTESLPDSWMMRLDVMKLTGGKTGCNKHIVSSWTWAGWAIVAMSFDASTGWKLVSSGRPAITKANGDDITSYHLNCLKQYQDEMQWHKRVGQRLWLTANCECTMANSYDWLWLHDCKLSVVWLQLWAACSDKDQREEHNAINEADNNWCYWTVVII